MRTIKIEFNIPDEYEDDYSDVCADIVVEDFLKPEIGFRVLYDSNKQSLTSTIRELRKFA